MRAIIIAVGSEMLEQGNVDTNSIYISKKLLEHGILTDMKVVVGDDLVNLSWMIKNAAKRSQLLILTGGLGPTEDDMTREATADALKRELEFNEEIVDSIRERLKKRGMKMPEIITRQGFVIQGSEVLPNEQGSAPGLFLEHENCKIALLPGPPKEMQPIFDRLLEEKIAPLSNFFIYRHSFKLAGIGESAADSMIADIYTKYKNVRTTILASPGVIDIHLLGRSKKTVDEAKADVDELVEKIKERIADYLVSEDNISLEQFIVEQLSKRGLTLATAESCTGGGLGNVITNVPGSSDVFLGGVTAYSNEIKMKLLEVEEYILTRKGAVSKETAKQMADGVRKLTGADIGISITGIAGPGGGSKGKPVGLVFMHLAAKDKDIGTYRIFPGERNVVKTLTINYCLCMVKDYLKELDNASAAASGDK